MGRWSRTRDSIQGFVHNGILHTLLDPSSNKAKSVLPNEEIQNNFRITLPPTRHRFSGLRLRFTVIPNCGALEGDDENRTRTLELSHIPREHLSWNSILVDRRIRYNDYRHRSAPSWLMSQALSWTISTLRRKFSEILLAVAMNDSRTSEAHLIV